MNTSINKILFLGIIVMFSSCDKDNDTIEEKLLNDKQIRFPLPSEITYTGATTITSGQDNLYKFNIDYFIGVDSVIYTIWSSVPTAGNKCSIELFDITDNQPIAGSLIEATTNSEAVLYQSSNIKSGFPHKEITIGLRIKGGIAQQTVNATSGFLYLYRK